MGSSFNPADAPFQRRSRANGAKADGRQAAATIENDDFSLMILGTSIVDSKK
jgi:hypothetical protein